MRSYLFAAAVATALAGADASYAGPFLELEDGDQTVVVLKPTGEKEVEVSGCSALYGTPKLCAMNSRTAAVGPRITQLTEDAAKTDTEHDAIIDSNAARINTLSTTITDTGSRTTNLEIEQMNSMKTLKVRHAGLQPCYPLRSNSCPLPYVRCLCRSSSKRSRRASMASTRSTRRRLRVSARRTRLSSRRTLRSRTTSPTSVRTTKRRSKRSPKRMRSLSKPTTLSRRRSRPW